MIYRITKLMAMLLASTAAAAAAGYSRPAQQQQAVLGGGRRPVKGVGHFSEWSRATKKEFLIDWQAGKENEWTIVQGNEAGDLDSMTSALTWAYHLSHSTANTSHPLKAIALLQTPSIALDLRPENKLALDNSQMTTGHEDLLKLDELPEDPETLGPKLRGIVLVDHGEPLRKWRGANILSVFDHHADRGGAPDAEPRIYEKVASCATLVARQMLDELEALPEEYHMPHELLELILSAIAIDSGALDSDVTTDTDVEVSKRVLRRSEWAAEDLADVMDDLEDELSKAKKDLNHLGLRDLLRRDWKGDLVDTPSPRVPTVSLGLASVPFSMEEQILKTDFQELFNWFATEAAWTAEVGVDVSVVLSKYKIKEKGKKKKKYKQITLVVRDDVRIDDRQADALFAAVKTAIEASDALDLQPWSRNGELSHRQFVWIDRTGASRKVVRPIVESAVRDWDQEI